VIKVMVEVEVVWLVVEVVWLVRGGDVSSMVALLQQRQRCYRGVEFCIPNHRKQRAIQQRDSRAANETRATRGHQDRGEEIGTSKQLRLLVLVVVCSERGNDANNGGHEQQRQIFVFE